jgi:hypothetical protein
MVTERLKTNFYAPINIYFVYWVKFIIGSLYLWKLLSRDFSNIAFWPQSVVSGYPVDIYPPDYILTTGIFPFFDLVTFHFVHWVLPYPSGNLISIIQVAAIFLSVVFIVSPLKISRASAILLYILVAYLWGFVFRLGQDIDAVFLLHGALLAFCLLPVRRQVAYYRQLRFLILYIFVIYYFFSGINKFIDLSYLQFFKYDLVNINLSLRNAFEAENAPFVPRLPFADFRLASYLNMFGALVTYFIHLLAPLLLLDARLGKVLAYWIFYSIFHLMTAYVGILFTMNFFAWLLILPVYNLVGNDEK